MRGSQLNVFWCAVLLATCGLPSMSAAFEIFGAGARSQSLSGAVVALVDDYTAVYHNPAGMVFGKQSVGLGLRGVYDRSSVLLMPRPTGYEPPNYGTRVNERSDTPEAGASGSVVLGGSFAPLDQKLTISGVAMLPFDGVAGFDTRYADEREQYFSQRLGFTRLGERVEREAFGFGLAYALQPWLAMGLGIVFLPAVETVNYVYTPNPVEPELAYLNVGVKNGIEQAVTAGLLIKANDFISIGLAFRDEVRLSMTGRNDIQVAGAEDDGVVLQPLVAYQNYQPLKLTAGIAGTTRGGTSLSLDGAWVGWSRYADDHGHVPNFEDVLEWSVGIEVPYANRSTARFGGAWRPSPVPPQDGRYNYVDNDRVAFSVGGGKALEVWGRDFQIDIGVQVQWLRPRSIKKKVLTTYPKCSEGETRLCDEVEDQTDRPETIGLQTGNPGFPGYSHGGYMISAGMDLKWIF
ncbi:MAG: outer membrane protein transport protein [Myxococcota bacterium]|nr:outer membrane protein transport protein [Myxococcota bacterium]